MAKSFHITESINKIESHHQRKLIVILKQVFLVLTIVFSFSNCHLQKSEKLPLDPINNRQYISIASYNIFSLGHIASKYKKPQGSQSSDNIPQRIQNNAQLLAKRNLDLIALQEVVAGKSGEWALVDLTHQLNKNYGKRYKWLLSKEIGPGFGFRESIAFLYDSVKVTTDEKIKIIPSNGGRNFVKCSFKSGNFDFTLIGVHLSWSNAEHRISEVKKINSILYHPEKYASDPDVIVLGDFNRFGNNQRAIKEIHFSSEKMFCPTIEFWDPQFNKVKQVSALAIQGKKVPSNDSQLLSTTVSKNHKAYDLILCTSDAKEEFETPLKEIKYNRDFGIIAFDHPTSIDFIAASQEDTIKYKWSDHRPIWVRFRTDKDTQDHQIYAP